MQGESNLLLSEVQLYNPADYAACRVHYAGFAGKGRDWEYRAGGDPFEFQITPPQAYFLSALQDSSQRGLTEAELRMVSLEN